MSKDGPGGGVGMGPTHLRLAVHTLSAALRAIEDR
jgi:hypothetical protein